MAWQTMFNSKAFSPTTTLTQEIGPSDTRIYVADVSVFPAVPTLATIGIASDLAEVVRVTAIGNNFIDVERGYVGAAKSFTANAPISRNFSSKDQDIIQANLQFLKDNALFEVKAENIPANSVSNDKLAQTATNTIKGRKSTGQGNVEDLSASDVRTMLDIQKGADVTNTVLEAAGDTTIADNDKLVLVDVSVSSGSKIRTVLWSAIKNALNNLFVPKTRTVNTKALSEDISLTAADVGADATGAATAAVSNHNSNTDAHSTLFATKQDKIDAIGILKRNTAGDVVQALPSVDYATADDAKVFVVTLTPGSGDLASDYVSDKTTAEIFAAYNANKNIICRFGSSNSAVMSLTNVESESLIQMGYLTSGGMVLLDSFSNQTNLWSISQNAFQSPPTYVDDLSFVNTLQPNTIYTVSNVSDFVFKVSGYPEWSHIYMTTGATVSISIGNDDLGNAPQFPDGSVPAFEANSTYEIDVWKNIWYVQKVSSSS